MTELTRGQKSWQTRHRLYGDAGAPAESVERMSKGGRRTGKAKRRGDSEYYSALAKRKKPVDKPID